VGISVHLTALFSSVRFPHSGNKWDKAKMIPSSELLDRILARHPNLIRSPDELNDTARSWKIPGYQGSLGFISSMSDHFCGTCNRLRITADGQIKVFRFLNEIYVAASEIYGLFRSVYLMQKRCHYGTKCDEELRTKSFYELSAGLSLVNKKSMWGWRTSMSSRIGR